jgi:hypothetical protein
VVQAAVAVLLLAVLLAELVLPIKAMMVELVVLIPLHLMAAVAGVEQARLVLIQRQAEQVELVAQVLHQLSQDHR